MWTYGDVPAIGQCKISGPRNFRLRMNNGRKSRYISYGLKLPPSALTSPSFDRPDTSKSGTMSNEARRTIILETVTTMVPIFASSLFLRAWRGHFQMSFQARRLSRFEARKGHFGFKCLTLPCILRSILHWITAAYSLTASDVERNANSSLHTNLAHG